MATPKLALIPTGYKAGKLYSVLPESGVGDFTVVRATEATRVNEEGLIETMGANVPRLDYSGGGCPVLLTEGQSTNLITYSSDYTDASWNKVNSAGSTLPNITSNYGISPDGTQNADRVQVSRASGAGDFSSVYKSITTSSVNRAHSIWLKSLSGTPTILILNNNGVYVSQKITTEWVRYELDLGVGTVTEIQLSVVGSNFVANVSESADFLAWGAQLEAGSYPTSYIKSEGSAVTRNGDQVNGAGDAATFNDSEGVLMAEISALANDGTQRWISIGSGSASNRVSILYPVSGSEQIGCSIRASSSSVYGLNVNVTDASIPSKVAVKYKNNDCAFWINGFEIDKNTGISISFNASLSELAFDSADGGFPFYGNTSQIQYFNTVLTDSELEKLTSWTSFIEMAQAQNYNII